MLTVLFVSHDANIGGAQSVLINIISWIKSHTKINIKILCLAGGKWLQRFETLGNVKVWNDDIDLISLYSEVDIIYGNTVVVGRKYNLLSALNKPIITHFHELNMSIDRYASDCIDDTIKYSSHFIACSYPVENNLIDRYNVIPDNVTTVHASIIPDKRSILNDEEKIIKRKELGLVDKFLVMGCGIGMAKRKGADLYIDVARKIKEKGYDNFHFYWIGDFRDDEIIDSTSWKEIKSAEENLSSSITFLGFKNNAKDYIAVGDMMLLTSREDPFPLVALESAESGLPTICFKEAGGMPYFVEGCGYSVPYLDTNSMANKIIELMNNPNLVRSLGNKARIKFLDSFTIDKTTPLILQTIRKISKVPPTVSIILPNYNHEIYLSERIESIINQTFQDYELI